MEVEWLYLELNNKKLRINKNDSFDIYCWREYKTIPDVWVKAKGSCHVSPSGYKRYKFKINQKIYSLSRIIYKAHNKDWEIDNSSMNNFIDHINRDSTDNRIENLRVVTNQQNQFNRNVKGYYWNKTKKKWQACIRIDKKKKNLGSFDKKEDAREAYLKAKEIHHKI
jgi:hypothetical protein